MINSTHVIILSRQEWSDTTIDPYASWLNTLPKHKVNIKQCRKDNKTMAYTIKKQFCYPLGLGLDYKASYFPPELYDNPKQHMLVR